MKPEQQAIWLAEEAELAGEHHCVFRSRVAAPVEGERLELALQRLIARHPLLRTTFHAGPDGAPVQRTRATLSFQLEFVDARRWGDRELNEIVRLTSRQPIDLSASVLRAVLFTRAADDHLLLIVAHRIAIDERRLRLLLQDLQSLYGGDLLPLPALPVAAAVSHDHAPGLPRSASGADSVGIHRLFEARVTAQPHAVALIEGTQRMTYAELDGAANRLARRLRAGGVDPRSCVAVDLPLSLTAAIAHLAVLKVGGVSLPLAPLAAGSDLTPVLPAARPGALITADATHASMSEAPTIILEAAAILANADATSAEPLGVGVRPEDAAVIGIASRSDAGYAVPFSHGGVQNLLAALRDDLRLGFSDRALAVGPLDARSLVLDILLPLSSGATVVLGSGGEALEPAWVCGALAEHQITAFRASGELWLRLIEDGWAGTPGLRALCDASDPVAFPHSLLHRRTGEIWSLYGQMETTICCAATRVRHGGGLRPVGEPLPNLRLHLLDDQLRPVQAGQTGTLYVGGVGVVRGYMGAASGAEDRFLPDPFAPDGRGLLFRTGDHALLRIDGGVELLEPMRDG